MGDPLQTIAQHINFAELAALPDGLLARGGQAIDATLVPAPRQHIGKEDKERSAQGTEPDGNEAQPRPEGLPPIPRNTARATLATSSA